MFSTSSAWAQQDVAQASPAPPKQTKAQREEARHTADLKKDRELGEKYAADILKELKMSTRADQQARVERIGACLAQVANTERVKVSWGDRRQNNFDYKFYVVQGKEVNAFSLPGGKIFVFEGLLDFAESDDEVAGVLAHEIAHASFRHIATMEREQEKLSAITFPLIVLSILVGGESGSAGMVTGQLYNQAMGSGWSVRAEESADSGGLQYLQKTTYNTLGMLTFMERLAWKERREARTDWGIYRTHPPTRERARALSAALQNAGVRFERSKVSTSLSLQSTPDQDQSVKLMFAGVEVARLIDDKERIAGIIARVNAFMDTAPSLNDLKLQHGQLLGRGQRLFSLTEQDAEFIGKSLPAATEDVFQGMRRAIFELSYRLWDAN